jgi:thiol-disulfide isomerase/thioredoxin
MESFNQILELFPIVVVDVWADWCNPCKLILPKYINLAVKYKQYFEQQKIIFLKDEAKKDEFFIHKNDVTVVPSFIFYFYKKKYVVDNLTKLDEFIQDGLHNLD